MAQSVERLAFKGGASLFLGAIPYDDERGHLAALMDKATAAALHIEQSALPPLKCVQLVDSIDRIWSLARPMVSRLRGMHVIGVPKTKHVPLDPSR